MVAKKTPRPPSKRKLAAEAQAAFEKDYTALKSYMLGRGYSLALKALTFAEQHHTGFRKNGYTPEFHHQLIICFTIINLRGIEAVEQDCLVLALLHDLLEDKAVSKADIANNFGDEMAAHCEALAKKSKFAIPMIIKTTETYVQGMLEHPVRVIVKGADRGHNVQSMHDAFKPEKRDAYLKETNEVHLPMLRQARKLYPQHYFAFTGLSFMLKRQVELYQASQASEKTMRASAAREVTAAINDRSKATGEAQLLRLNEGIRVINRDLDEERKMVKSLREENTQLQMKLEREHDMRINTLKGVVAAVQGLSASDKVKFWSDMAAEAGDRYPFEMPSKLEAFDLNNRHGEDFTDISGNSRPY